MDLRIVGVDPAPAKGLTIFDPTADGGPFLHVEPALARGWVESARVGATPLLLGWDAPIIAEFRQSYTTRPIERFLGRRLGPGVSVLGYSGCPHWTISLDVLGRPCCCRAPSLMATEASSLMGIAQGARERAGFSMAICGGARGRAGFVMWTHSA